MRPGGVDVGDLEGVSRVAGSEDTLGSGDLRDPTGNNEASSDVGETPRCPALSASFTIPPGGISPLSFPSASPTWSDLMISESSRSFTCIANRVIGGTGWRKPQRIFGESFAEVR